MIASSSFDVFVSYNSADRDAVERIAHGLKERGLRVFLDRWELQPGQSWPEVLERHIGNCRSAAIVLGPAGMGTWQQREQYLALDRQAGDDGFRVIPVLLPGAEPALGFLALNTWIDFRQGVGDPGTLDLLAATARGRSPAVLAERSRRTITTVCPYRGLEPFREEDAPFFFGREAFTQRLLQHVISYDLVAVVGASGSGKSSVVRAGLVPQLRRGAHGTIWDILTLTPGAEPLAALARTIDPPTADGLIAARAQVNAAAARLRSGEVRLRQLVGDHLARQPGTQRLLLVVDQFEELATLTGDEDAGHFVDQLLDASAADGALTVLLTLRSDFYTQLVQRRDLADRLQDAVVHVGPPSAVAPDGGPSELESIVRGPAEAVGLGFEDGLVARIVADVGDDPGNLPLLEYLLTELWHKRGNGLLAHEAYDALGGVRGAIARRADEAYDRLTADRRLAARRLFLSLVHPGDGQQDTRAVAPFPTDAHEADVARHFAGAGVRLLVADDDALRGRVIQLSHEALIRSWGRLRRWVDRNRDTLRARERVRERMRRWQAEGGPGDLLLPRGLELEEGRRLLESDGAVSLDEVRAYIVRSIAAGEREQARERRRSRLTRTALAFSLLLLALTGWQWRTTESAREDALLARDQAQRQAQRAERERLRADLERDLAVAQRLAASAARVLDENPGESALAAMLAVESQARRNTPEVNALLRDVLSLTPLDTPRVDFPWVGATLQLSADGRVQVLGNRDVWGGLGGSAGTASWSSLQLLDGTSLSSLRARRFGGHMRPLLSPDGRWLVSAGFGRRLVITALASGEVVLDVPTRHATFPVFAPDGSALYIATQTGTVAVRRPPDWTVTQTLRFPVAGARHQQLIVGIADDGGRLFIIDRRRDAFVVPTDGSTVTRLPLKVDRLKPWHATNYLSDGLVSPAGPVGLTRQATGETRLWDLVTGRRLLDLADAARPAVAAFSPDGRAIATADSNGTVSLRAVDGGAVVHTWQHRDDWDHEDDRIHALAFSRDGTLLASAGEDGAVVVWNVADGALQHRFDLESPVLSLAFDAADETLLAGTEDGTLLRLDPRSGGRMARQRFNGAVAHIETGGRGGTVAVAINETRSRSNWDDISFVERATGRELSHISFNGELRAQRINGDGSRFAAFDPARDTVIVWDTASGESVLEIPTDAMPLGFSPGSDRLLLHDAVGPLRVADAASGEMLFDLGEPGGVNEVFHDASADVVITRGIDESQRGWDLGSGDALWRQDLVQRDARVRLSRNGRAVALYLKTGNRIDIFETPTGRRIGTLPAVEPRDFAVSDDGSRLLTTGLVKNRDTGQHGNEIAIFDVRNAAVLQRRRIDVDAVFIRSVGGPYLALSGTPIPGEQPTAWMELIDWRDGRVLWSLSEQSGGIYQVMPIDRAADRILVQGPSSRALYALRSGERIWLEPGSSLRAAADVPDSGLIALADATSLNENNDVIRLLDRATGHERRRMVAGGFARHVAATADGTRVVAAVEGERWRGVRVWQVADGRLVREIELDANPEAVLPLLDPDRVAVQDFAQNLRVFDLRTGSLVHRIAHTRFADDIAVARDADRAVTVADASLRVWDTRSGREIAHRVSHGDATSVSISPDGTRVAYLTRRPRTVAESSEFPAVVVWRLAGDAEPAILPVEDVNGVRFDPSGRFLALQHSRGASVRLVDAVTLQTVRTVSALRNGRLGDPAFSDDSRLLLVRDTGRYRSRSTTDRHSLRAFDIATGDELARFDSGPGMVPLPGPSAVLFQDVQGRWRSTDLSRIHLDPVLTAAEPDRLVAAPHTSKLLAPAYWNPTLVHDTSSGRTLRLTRGDEPFNVLHAAIDPGGRFVALSLRERDWRDDSPGEILILDAADGAELARLQTKRGMWNVAFVDGDDAVILSELRGHLPREPDQLLLHWNWRNGSAKTLVADNPVPYFAVSRDGRRFATAEGSRNPDDDVTAPIGTLQLRIWDGSDGAERARVPLDFDPSGISLSPDGRYVTVGDDARILLLRAADGSEIARFQANPTRRVTEVRYAIGTSPRLISGQHALGFAGEGRLLVIAQARDVLLYDTATGTNRRLRGTEPLKEIAVSTDGVFLATRGERFVNVWAAVDDVPELLIRFEAAGVRHLTFGGASGRELFALREGNIVRLRWRPAELGALACKAFADGDWRRGRFRVTGLSGPHPCESKDALAQPMAVGHAKR